VSDARPGTQTTHDSQHPYLPLFLWVLLGLTAAVRLAGMNRPLSGNFATKNVVYAMIARNWIEGRAGILDPTLDCLKGGRRSLHMLEFPVSAYLTAGLWRMFGGSLDVWGRATSVAFSVASVTLLFLLVRRWHGTTTAIGAGFVLALSPVSVIYGQAFMLEASLVFFTLATFYGVDRWLDGGRAAWLAGAALCFALLLLTKIYMLVLVLPLGVMVLFRNTSVLRSSRADGRLRSSEVEPGSSDGWLGSSDGWLGSSDGWLGSSGASPQRLKPGRTPDRAVALAAAGLAVLPAALWYAHAMHTAAPGSPHAAHIYFSLQRTAEAHRLPSPLLRTPDFYRQLLDDLTGVILTPLGFAFLLAGFLDKACRRHAVWLLAMAILVAALPRKFYEMNYYYMAVLPPLCVIAGLGWRVAWERLRPGRTATAGLVIVALVLSMRYAVKPAFVTPEDDRAVVRAGQAAQELTAAEEPVVTMHGATIDLVYYCHRPGWAVAPDTPELNAVLEECRRQGARYLVVAGPEAASGRPKALDAHTPVVRGQGFCVYQLRPGPSDVPRNGPGY